MAETLLLPSLLGSPARRGRLSPIVFSPVYTARPSGAGTPSRGDPASSAAGWELRAHSYICSQILCMSFVSFKGDILVSDYFLIGSELGKLREMGCYLLVFTQSLRHLRTGVFDAPLPF